MNLKFQTLEKITKTKTSNVSEWFMIDFHFVVSNNFLIKIHVKKT